MASAAPNYRDFTRLATADFATALTEERPDIDRRALAQALSTYHQDLGTLDQYTRKMLDKLAHPDSRAIVTGQQAGLLTGPAYSVHKAVDAILLARLHDTPERPVQAIYWVASQDHDSAEVCSTSLLDMSEHLHQLHLELPQGVPIGRITWRPEWTHEVQMLLEGFEAPQYYKTEVGALLERAMSTSQSHGPSHSYADVFARIMHFLLSQEGLLVLDPLHPAIAALMRPTLQQELLQPLESSKQIQLAAQQLEQKGLTPQLRRADQASNLFIELDNRQRQLLRVEGQRFFTDQGHSYSLSELQQLLDIDPTRITPAAGLRPVVQDAVLPTLAVVVGNGELAYISQLRKVYPLHGLRQPLLWSRLSVTWLEPNVSRILRRLEISPDEIAILQNDPELLLGRALAQQRSVASLSRARLEQLRSHFQSLYLEMGQLDPTLENSVERTEQRTLFYLELLQKNVARALANAEDTKEGQLKRLKKHLLPLGQPQERQMNFLTYALKHGLRHTKSPLSLLLGLPAGFVGEVFIE